MPCGTMSNDNVTRNAIVLAAGMCRLFQLADRGLTRTVSAQHLGLLSLSPSSLCRVRDADVHNPFFFLFWEMCVGKGNLLMILGLS